MISGQDSGAGIVLGLLASVLFAAVYVWVALALSAAFRKMGEEPWRAWVPFLNVATLLRWGGFSPWLVLLGLLPGPGTVAVWVLLVVSVNRINPGFGYGAGFTVLAAFLFPVWATIVGFGPAPWRGARPGGALPPPTRTWAESTVLPPLVADGPGESWPPIAPAPAPAAEPASATAPQAWAPPPAPEPRRAEPEPPRAAEPPRAEAEPDRSEVRPDPTAPTPTARTAMPSPPVPAGLISSVPGRGDDDEAPAPRMRRSASTADRAESDVFPELTGEVSAVSGSPAAGAPVRATSWVSAQERERDERADDESDDDLDRTVIVRRGRARWEPVPPTGSPVALTADVVIVGRNPAPDPAHPRAQLIPIVDATRTVSKTHARLERRGEVWRIVVLGSTNGVLLPGMLGADVEVEPGTDAEVTERFLLGDASIRLQRVDPGA